MVRTETTVKANKAVDGKVKVPDTDVAECLGRPLCFSQTGANYALVRFPQCEYHYND